MYSNSICRVLIYVCIDSPISFSVTVYFLIIPILFLLCCLYIICFMLVAKHVYGWNKLLDGDSNPDMPDQYTAHQV